MTVTEAAAIVRAAQSRGMTIAAIADKVRVHRNQVFRWLRGDGEAISRAPAHNLRLLERANIRHKEGEKI